MKKRVRIHAAACVTLLVLCSCNLFVPSFVFNNPHDPNNPWQLGSTFGTAYMSDLSGIPSISDIAVTPNGSIVGMCSSSQEGFWEVDTASHAGTHYSSGTNIFLQYLCVDASGQTFYGVGGDRKSVYAVDRATHRFTSIYKLPDGSTASFNDIAYDRVSSSLFLLVADPAKSNNLVYSMSTSGSMTGTIDVPQLTNVNSIAVYGPRLFCSCTDTICVLVLDSVTGAINAEIWYDGTLWHNVASPGTVTTGSGSPINLSCDTNRLYVSFWQGAPVTVIDPSNYATPVQSTTGNAADFSDFWQARISASDSGTAYVSDPHFLTIREFGSGVVIYANRARIPGELTSIRDMCTAADGTTVVLDNNLWECTALSASGQFNLFGTAGNGANELAWPQSVSSIGSDFYVGCNGGGNKIVHFSSSGSLLDQHVVGTEGSPDRMCALPDGRLLVWTNRSGGVHAFYTYTTSTWGPAAGPFVPDSRLGTASDLSLCVSTDGKIYCTFYAASYAAVGTLSNDLSTYTEIWNSASETVFDKSDYAGNRYMTRGIGPAPTGDIWVAFSGLASIVRFTPTGQVFASFSAGNDYTGAPWAAGKIVAYSLNKDGNCAGPALAGLGVSADFRVTVGTNWDVSTVKVFTPSVALQ